MSTGALVLIWIWVISFVITQIEFLPRKGKGSSPLWDKDYNTIPPKLMICIMWLIVSGLFAPLVLFVIICVELKCLWDYVIERDTAVKDKEEPLQIFQQPMVREREIRQRRDQERDEANLHEEMVTRAVAEPNRGIEEQVSPSLEEMYLKITPKMENETPDYSPPKKDSEIKNRFEIMDLDK